jgi:putative transposase
VTAAKVMLNWALGLGTSLTNAESPSSTKCGSMRQLGAKKRQKSQREVELGGETPSAYAVG